ncbi:MAG TPA: glycosyltransferase, partial [Methylomirabilota bacterium]|nr:glycosyltransferase [Methylomirabilota bacterium]
RTPGSGTDRLCIGVELRRVVVGTGGGLSLAIKGLLDTLFARHPEHHYVLFGTIFNASLFDRAPDHVEVHTVPPTKWFYFTVDRLARERELDVLIRSFPTLDRMRFPLRRQIFVIPDLQHELFPEFFAPDVLADRRASFRRALAGAGAIATISEHSRQTLLQHPEAHGRDVFLMTPALQPEYASGTAAELSEAEQALLPRRPFFVYPANLWPHKNHRRLLAAFGRFRAETGADVELVLTGHPEGWADLASEFPGLPVRHLGFVQPALLRALLERATALVFFSLCEGFGMPLLEAFALGTPVICSNQGSLPEVGGDAVLTCDPTDVTAMSRLMARIVVDQPLRAELAARGRRRLDAYSWERSAESLLRACRRVAASPPGADPPEAEPVDPTAPPGSPSPQPLVSIVTPSYGQARFLGRTIASVLGQSYPDLEYIVIDGGSTDGSVDLLQQHGDRIRWTSEPDRGQSHALNKGFARARGEILAYLNADDVLAPGAVERAVTYLRDHPACDMVYGRAWFIDERDRLLEPYPTAPFSFERLMDDNCVCQPATFWRRRIAERVGGFDESLHIALDYQYWIRIVLAGGRIDYLPEVLALSRRHTEAKTWADRERTYSEIFTVCRRLTGRVSLSYFIGLWHYRVWEAPEGWPHRLRGHPRLTHWVARLHRIGYHLHYRRYLLR